MKKSKHKSNRSRLISLIHAQKNSCGLDDATYRIIVNGSTGKDSCADCSMKELKTIFDDLNSILFKQGKDTFFYRPRWENPSMSDAVVARAKKILGNDWKGRLDSFVMTKFSKKTYKECDTSELRIVMAFLTNIERKESTSK